MDLHKTPPGLLAAFNLKTLGRNPHQFGEQVTPICEVSDYYLANLIGSAQESLALVTGPVSGSAQLQVPDGEAWRMIAAGGNVFDFTGAVTSSYGLVVIPSSIGVAQPSTPINAPTTFTGAVGSVLDVGVLFPQPLLLMAGARIAFRIMSALGGADTVTLRVQALFYRLPQ